MRLPWISLAVMLLAVAAGCGDGTDDNPDRGDGTQSPAAAARDVSPTAGPRDSMTVTVDTPAATPTPPGATATSGSSGTAPASPSPTPTTRPGATVNPSSTYPPFVDAAIEDLAARLNVAPAGISVTTWSEVEWPNGSLGCPQPGMLYTQALVPGYRVILRHNGVDYAYHGRLNGAPFYCANPQ